jgi:hypothetical protein
MAQESGLDAWKCEETFLVGSILTESGISSASHIMSTVALPQWQGGRGVMLIIHLLKEPT